MAVLPEPGAPVRMNRFIGTIERRRIDAQVSPQDTYLWSSGVSFGKMVRAMISDPFDVG